MMRMPESKDRMAEIFGRDRKGKASLLLYATGIGLAFLQPWLALVPYIAVALIWLLPDPRVERYLQRQLEAGNTEHL
jgi:hypothetical protein